MASISVIEANTPSGNVIPPQAEAMIEVKDLVKDYGPTRAVNGISFRVNKGEILGFLGPNGAGKSTTMRILTCYTPATSGLARIGGFDTHRQSEEARRLLGYLPESAPLYLDMYVRSYLNFMHEVKGYPRAKRRAAVDEALEECGLTQVAGRLIRNLSKGYRQRVGLAQAIIGDPKVMVLDEPTVGLDPGQIAEIRQLIKGMAGRRTVILSTHILPEVSMTCQKVIIINKGRIEAEGTPESLTDVVGGANLIRVTAAGSTSGIMTTLEKVTGVARVSHERDVGTERAVYRVETRSGVDPRAEIAAALHQNSFPLYELASSGLSLEDIFLRVISR